MSKKYYIAVEDDSRTDGLFMTMNVENEIEDMAEWVGITTEMLRHLIRKKKPYNGMLFATAPRYSAI